MKVFLFAVSLMTVSSVFAATPSAPVDTGTLTQVEALKRSEVISDIDYALTIDTTVSDKVFDGNVVISFSLKSSEQDLRIDTTDVTFSKVTINDQLVSEYKILKRSIEIPKKYFQTGKNKIQISYQGKYSHMGLGLHRFEDPVDKSVYLYTQFEPFDANRVFPCFDQPDLKAQMALTVIASKNWEVVSATSPERVTTVKKNKQWEFKKTPKLSTYLYSLHAGPYKVFKSNAGNIPLRLFVRQSMAKYLRADEWFKITRQGLAFYGKYFDYPYPFEKYDQIVVPEFTMGAMENTASVTYSEEYLKRGVVTSEERESLANVILHEMAHMWFGDLVTMKWWDDLWLNESFASYMATLALAQATEYKDAWVTFYGDMKKWGYWQDQISTTHPIAGAVVNTDEAFTTFDGITYGKGASVMKQLSFFVSETKFQKGIQNYFKKYAYRNTVVDNFISTIAEASQQDLTEWSRLWLTQATPDTLSTSFECQNGKLTQLKVSLENKRNASVRPHALQIAMFATRGNKFESINTQTVIISKPEQIIPIIESHSECPDAIIPNYGDFDYIKVELDSKSLKSVQENFSKAEDMHLRMMLSDSLWEMVRDQKIKQDEYKKFIVKAIETESNFKILSLMASSVSGKGQQFNSVFYFDTKDAQFKKIIEDSYWSLLEKAAPGSDIQRLWLENYIDAAHTPGALRRLNFILAGTQKIKGQKIDQDLRWDILSKLAQNSEPRLLSLLDVENKKDASARGKSSSFATLAAVPTIENKKKWFAALVDKKSDLSNEQQESVMRALFPSQQNELKQQLAISYFSFLEKETANFDENYLSNFTRFLGPAVCDVESNKKLSDFLRENENLPASVQNRLGQLISDNERCWKIRNYNQIR